ncbi:MAG: Peptide deformylase, partial [uncultured Sphingosinicella sp.]
VASAHHRDPRSGPARPVRAGGARGRRASAPDRRHVRYHVCRARNRSCRGPARYPPPPLHHRPSGSGGRRRRAGQEAARLHQPRNPDELGRDQRLQRGLPLNPGPICRGRAPGERSRALARCRRQAAGRRGGRPSRHLLPARDRSSERHPLHRPHLAPPPRHGLEEAHQAPEREQEPGRL